MENLKIVKTENLKTLIDQTRRELVELETELERREEALQHREIANLENHMRSAEFSLKTIRDFVQFLRDERK